MEGKGREGKGRRERKGREEREGERGGRLKFIPPPQIKFLATPLMGLGSARTPIRNRIAYAYKSFWALPK